MRRLGDQLSLKPTFAFKMLIKVYEVSETDIP